jgi:hypothetical protein
LPDRGTPPALDLASGVYHLSLTRLNSDFASQHLACHRLRPLTQLGRFTTVRRKSCEVNESKNRSPFKATISRGKRVF